MDNKRCALYHRVSTGKQNPTNARDVLRQAAAVMGYTIVLDVEEVESGGTMQRPGIESVMQSARRGEINGLLCWRVDRFTRAGQIDTVKLVDELRKLGVTFHATSQGINIGPTSDPTSDFHFSIMVSMAEYERETIRERTKLGMDAARRRGVHVGRPRLPAHLRADAWLLRREGLTQREVAATLGVSVFTVCRYLSETPIDHADTDEIVQLDRKLDASYVRHNRTRH